MEFDRDLIASKLRRWEKYLDNYRLPEWDRIPDIGLFMEQVIMLLKQYLDYLPPDIKEEQFITASAINNYVRKKIMPEPVKKRYYRVHIAYLLIICSLKQCLSIPTVQGIIPMDIPEEKVKEIYESYRKRHLLACGYFTHQVRLSAGGILGHEGGNELNTESTEDLIVSFAVISGFARLMSEKLLMLDGKHPEDFPPEQGGSAAQ